MPRQRLLRTVIACAILTGFAWLVAVPWALRTEQRSHAAAFVATSAHAEVVVARREVALGKATHLSKDHALRAHVAQDCVLLGASAAPAFGRAGARRAARRARADRHGSRPHVLPRSAGRSSRARPTARLKSW